MIGDIRDFEDGEGILLDFDPLDFLVGFVVEEHQVSGVMVLQIVGEGVESVLDDVVMAEQVVSFEVVGGKDVVEGVLFLDLVLLGVHGGK